MDIYEEFKQLIENSVLADMVEKIERTELGCKYVYDGKLYCQIVFHEGEYHDVQDYYYYSDRDIISQLGEHGRYASVREIFDRMIADDAPYR